MCAIAIVYSLHINGQEFLDKLRSWKAYSPAAMRQQGIANSRSNQRSYKTLGRRVSSGFLGEDYIVIMLPRISSLRNIYWKEPTP